MVYEHKMPGRPGSALNESQKADLERLVNKRGDLTDDEQGRLQAFRVMGDRDDSRRAADRLGWRQ